MDPTTQATPDALVRAEAHLVHLTRGGPDGTLERWRAHCPALVDAPISAPCQLKAWLRRLPTEEADAVLRGLVAAAQERDPAALLAVVACLAPGIRALARRAHVTVEEAVSEVALRVLDYPYVRRRAVAAGLLLDARNRLHRLHQRQQKTCPLDEGLVRSPAETGDPEAARSPVHRVVQLVCQAHRQGLLDRTDTELILRTRVAGHRIAQLAAGFGLTPSAAYQRRSRAEARLAQAVA
jgi:hypothetical protein